MTKLAAQRHHDTGLAATYGAAASSFEINPDTDVLHVKNGGLSPINVTAVTPGTVDNDLAIPDRVVAVANGTDKFIGPFPAKAFKDPSDGLVHITLSATASVTVAVLSL